MGATKVNFNHVRAILTREVRIEGFELQKKQRCKLLTPDSVNKGDTVLVKASFLNACVGQDENGEPDEDNILYRRRVVPFVTKVKQIRKLKTGNKTSFYVEIENISDADYKYLYRKMADGLAKESDMLEIEAKKITFAV